MNSQNPFNAFTKISIDDYGDFLERSEKQYSEVMKRKYVIPETSVNYRYDEISKEILHDRFTILYKDVEFHCLLNYSDYIGNSKPSLFVIFSGSISKGDVIPVFKRWSYFPFVGGYVLSIADPMLHKYKNKNLTLGWYYGSQDINYMEYISVIVKKIQYELSVEDKDVYFFGSSGGGYTALQISYYFDGTTHIALNPQILIKNYDYASYFSKIVGFPLDYDDVFRRNQTCNIMLEKKKNKFFIIQNIQDGHHCKYHLFPLCKTFGIDSIALGLNYFRNLLIWIYNINVFPAHNVQGDQLIFSYIIHMAHKFSAGDNFEITDFEDMTYKNISCIWRKMEYFNNRLAKKTGAYKSALKEIHESINDLQLQLEKLENL